MLDLPDSPLKAQFQPKSQATLSEIERLDQSLEQRFRCKFVVESLLTRSMVSFQANKGRPVYRWYKYKEAFSASLVEYLFQKYQTPKGRILDPFAGSGTALFVASTKGIDADGIELLPIGQQIINSKRVLESEFTTGDIDILLATRQLRRKGLPCGERPDKVELTRQNQTGDLHAREALSENV